MTRLNVDLIKAARASLRKQGFVPADPQGMTPVDPGTAAAMAGGALPGAPPGGAPPMPPGPPAGGMPGGGAPPMPPGGGGLPPAGPMPTDPAALGGAPGQAPTLNVSLDDLMQLFAQVSGQGGQGAPGMPGVNEAKPVKAGGGKASLEAKVDELVGKFDMLLNTLGLQPGMIPAGAPPGGGGAAPGPGGEAVSMGAPSGITSGEVPTPSMPEVPGEENPLAPKQAEAAGVPQPPPLSPLPPEKPASAKLKARQPNARPVAGDPPPVKAAQESPALSLHRIIQNLSGL